MEGRVSIVDVSVVCGRVSGQEGMEKKSGEGLVPILRYGPEMVDSIFLHGCEIKSGSVLGTRLRLSVVDGSVVCGCVSGGEDVHC